MKSCVWMLFLLSSSLLLNGRTINSDLTGQTIISERVSKAGVRDIIAVDQDDAVHEIVFGLADSKRPVISANLGARVIRSGHMQISKFLPKDKVATAARRITVPDVGVMHVIIAWGYSSVIEGLEPRCSMYVFREREGDYEEVFSEELGEELNQFIVEDLNGDGKPEIVVSTTYNAEQEMVIWQIQSDGKVTELQKFDGYIVNTLLDRLMGQSIGTYVAQKSQRAGCYDAREYIWSRKLKKFASSHR